MQQQNQETAHSNALRIEGVLSDHPVISSMGRGGGHYATLSIRPTGVVGKGLTAQNAVWPVIVYRSPGVELMKSAMPGDIVQLRGAIQGAHFIVPRTTGRVDVILFD